MECPPLYHIPVVSIFGNSRLLQTRPFWSFKLALVCIIIIVHICFARPAFLLSYFDATSQFSIGESLPLPFQSMCFSWSWSHSHLQLTNPWLPGYGDWFRDGHMAPAWSLRDCLLLLLIFWEKKSFSLSEIADCKVYVNMELLGPFLLPCWPNRREPPRVKDSVLTKSFETLYLAKPQDK